MAAEHYTPSEATPGHDLIVVGASAGGVEALAELVSHLPADLPAAVCVVLHVPACGSSVLPAILSRRGALPAVHPKDGEALQQGRIYVAPPDHHLLVKNGQIRLTHGPAENGHRPAVDTLFRSAARSYGPRTVGVVLTGTLDDGTAGLQAIKMRGGKALVQDPEEALFPSMPHNAIEHVAVDAVEPLAGLAQTLVRLVSRAAAAPAGAVQGANVTVEEEAADSPPAVEVEVAALETQAIETPREGSPSAYACPACHGVLWEVEEGKLVRFRCRIGHAFSPESLLAAQSEGLEEALWVALRALEESATLAKRLQGRAAERGHLLAAQRFHEQAGDARQRAEVIREALTVGQVSTRSGPPPTEENSAKNREEGDART